MIVLAPAAALAARHSRHSEATFDPIENPLNDLPQLGQVGMLERFAPRLARFAGKRKSRSIQQYLMAGMVYCKTKRKTRELTSAGQQHKVA